MPALALGKAKARSNQSFGKVKTKFAKAKTKFKLGGFSPLGKVKTKARVLGIGSREMNASLSPAKAFAPSGVRVFCCECFLVRGAVDRWVAVRAALTGVRSRVGAETSASEGVGARSGSGSGATDPTA